jgi:hypothetical protein
MRVLYAILATLLAAPANSKYIVPGGRWHDTNGTLINAHGAGITFDQKTGRFWWFGEYKTQAQPEGGGVSVYSSEDLCTWTWGGLAISICFPFTRFIWSGMFMKDINILIYVGPIDSHLYISPDNIIQRPKVAYSPETDDYHVCRHFLPRSSYHLNRS